MFKRNSSTLGNQAFAADSDTVSTYQVSLVQLVTKTIHNSGHSIKSHKYDGLRYASLKASSFLLVINCTEET